MELIRLDLRRKYRLGKLVATLGVFDGLHLGHQKLIQRAVQIAKEQHAKSAVITFDPHPDYVLKKRKNEGYLTPLSEKKIFLEQMGVDFLILIPFTTKISNTLPPDFENKYLKKFNLIKIIVGYDYRYGKYGQGTTADLQKSFLLEVISEQLMNQERFASDVIRQELLSGNLEKANNMLGRPYNISGIVDKGNQIGQKMGFRTANINLSEKYQALKEGVYAVIVTVDGKKHIGVCNIGHNPTVKYLLEPRLEVHILDFTEDIYQKWISVDFLVFLREEKKFANLEELVDQIKEDVKATRKRIGDFI